MNDRGRAHAYLLCGCYQVNGLQAGKRLSPLVDVLHNWREGKRTGLGTQLQEVSKYRETVDVTFISYWWCPPSWCLSSCSRTTTSSCSAGPRSAPGNSGEDRNYTNMLYHFHYMWLTIKLSHSSKVNKYSTHTFWGILIYLMFTGRKCPSKGF